MPVGIKYWHIFVATCYHNILQDAFLDVLIHFTHNLYNLTNAAPRKTIELRFITLQFRVPKSVCSVFKKKNVSFVRYNHEDHTHLVDAENKPTIKLYQMRFFLCEISSGWQYFWIVILRNSGVHLVFFPIILVKIRKTGMHITYFYYMFSVQLN